MRHIVFILTLCAIAFLIPFMRTYRDSKKRGVSDPINDALFIGGLVGVAFSLVILLCLRNWSTKVIVIDYKPETGWVHKSKGYSIFYSYMDAYGQKSVKTLLSYHGKMIHNNTGFELALVPYAYGKSSIDGKRPIVIQPNSVLKSTITPSFFFTVPDSVFVSIYQEGAVKWALLPYNKGLSPD